MPFGPIFGALFYGVVCTWLALRLVLHGTTAARLSGVFLLILGLVLALGLLGRRPWARWAGVVVAVMLTGSAMTRLADMGQVTDHLLLLGAVVTGALLLIPATGAVRASEPSPRAWRGAVLPLVAAGAFTGLALTTWWSASLAPDRPEVATGTLPSSALAQRIRWVDYGAGLEAAREQGKPMLVTFVTDWCGFCTKMDRETWRAASVIERMGDVVPVRVDAEEGLARNGHVGSALARKYGVEGYPALILADADGKPLARSSGFLSAGQLLSFIDRSIGASGPPRSPTSGVSFSGPGS